LGGEAAEHYAVDGADAGTGEYGDGQFRDHAHINTNTVSFSNAVVAQYLCEVTYLFMQFSVGKCSCRFIGLIGFPDDGGLFAPFCQVAVQTIFGDVHFSTLEPFDVGFGEVPFQGGMPFFSPGKMFGDAGPESGGVFDALLVGALIGFKTFDLVGVRHGNAIRG